ncbi:MAG: hypothetical protein ACK4LB_00900 [Spirosomataceae bacterium]
MKTWIIVGSLLFLVPEPSLATTSSPTEMSKRGKRTKSGRYKKKKGLFGRKNDCGCPKH